MYFVLHALASFGWLKKWSEVSTKKLSDLALSYNEFSGWNNHLKASFDLSKNEVSCLNKELKEAKVALSVWDSELEKAVDKAAYFEDKSRSIEMFTMIKVCAKLL